MNKLEQFCFKYICCCCIIEESQKEPVKPTNQELEIAEARRIEQESYIRQRQMGLRSYKAEEAAGRFSNKLKNNRAPIPKMKKEITNAVDDMNSIVFNGKY